LFAIRHKHAGKCLLRATGAIAAGYGAALRGDVTAVRRLAMVWGWETKRGPAMANIENSASKLVLKEGSTTLTLDKDSGKATLQHKILLWNKKPVEFALSDIDDIAVKSETDGLSGAAIHHSVLHRRTGEITVLTTEEAADAAATVQKLRGFVGL
jgi:hypothetical protein